MNNNDDITPMNTSEEIIENIDENSENFDAFQENFPKEEKVEKHIQALQYVEKAKNIIQHTEAQAHECKLLLISDLKEYDNAKNSLKNGGLETCMKLLERVGVKTNVVDEDASEHVVFEPKEDIAPMAIKNVSSGKFTGMVYGLLAGAVTAVGLVYIATEKLGITLDITKVPSTEKTQNLMTSLSAFLGMESYTMGVTLFVSTVALVSVLTYIIRIVLKGNSNLHFAVKQFAEAEIYSDIKEDCKIEMDKVDAHMKSSIDTLKIYEVLFNEQKGKLERILHIEGEKLKSTEYHEKSYLEIRETKELIETINYFMGMPMSEEGRLSQKSVLLLERSKIKIKKILERLY